MNKEVKILLDNINKVVLGKEKVVKKILICLICGGHVLLEDVPGVGKTTIVSSFAKSINMSFNRIQFTPDLLPSDVVGVSIYNQKTGEFEFKKGPIYNNVVLADEINRTSPKTQSSLLEAMQEGQITVDGITYNIPKPFIVLATQNPIEYEGTFPLPEAQLDRFMMKISIGYPDEFSEMEILRKYSRGNHLDTIGSVISDSDILEIQKEVEEVYVDESIDEYVIEIAKKTREDENVRLGVSTRGALYLYKASKGYAYLMGRNYVLPDDVKAVAYDVLTHRIILKPESKVQELRERDIITRILNKVRVPVVRTNE